jgi:hypothetical protein
MDALTQVMETVEAEGKGSATCTDLIQLRQLKLMEWVPLHGSTCLIQLIETVEADRVGSVTWMH